jgi:hypothetical protein
VLAEYARVELGVPGDPRGRSRAEGIDVGKGGKNRDVWRLIRAIPSAALLAKW